MYYVSLFCILFEHICVVDCVFVKQTTTTCDLLIWDDDIIPGVTPMIEVTPSMDTSMEVRSTTDGNQKQVCTKCETIDEVMKAFESNEIAKWKVKYEDEKKFKWITLIMLINLIVFGWFVKN